MHDVTSGTVRLVHSFAGLTAPSTGFARAWYRWPHVKVGTIGLPRGCFRFESLTAERLRCWSCSDLGVQRAPLSHHHSCNSFPPYQLGPRPEIHAVTMRGMDPPSTPPLCRRGAPLVERSNRQKRWHRWSLLLPRLFVTWPRAVQAGCLSWLNTGSTTCFRACYSKRLAPASRSTRVVKFTPARMVTSCKPENCDCGGQSSVTAVRSTTTTTTLL